jgi:hypothetical protein
VWVLEIRQLFIYVIHGRHGWDNNAAVRTRHDTCQQRTSNFPGLCADCDGPWRSNKNDYLDDNRGDTPRTGAGAPRLSIGPHLPNHHGNKKTRRHRQVDGCSLFERETGIEPAYLAWEASALPLCYSRSSTTLTVNLRLRRGKARIDLCIKPNPLRTITPVKMLVIAIVIYSSFRRTGTQS